MKKKVVKKPEIYAKLAREVLRKFSRSLPMVELDGVAVRTQCQQYMQAAYTTIKVCTVGSGWSSQVKNGTSAHSTRAVGFWEAIMSMGMTA